MASNGVSLADPASSGIPAQLSGNYALYGIVDQTLWQEAGGAGDRLNGFVRVAVAPESDRSGMTWYADAGLAYKGLLPGREDDTVGVGFAHARLSPALADLAREQNALDGTSGPIPSFESVIEVSYQAVLTQAFSVQPFFQYVINPGGNAPDPDGPDRAIPNASVFGVRLAANF
jgi:porin